MISDFFVVIVSLLLMMVLMPLFLTTESSRSPLRYLWGAILFVLMAVSFLYTLRILLRFMAFALTVFVDALLLILFIGLIAWVTLKILDRREENEQDEK